MSLIIILLMAVIFALVVLQLCGRVVFIKSAVSKHQIMMSKSFEELMRELQTPLTILSAAIENMRNENPGLERDLDLMELNILRTVQLLHHTSEVVDSHLDRLELRVSQVDVMWRVKCVALSVEPMMRKKLIDYQVCCNPESMMGWVDMQKIDKTVTLLLLYVQKIALRGAQVQVNVKTNDRFNELSIQFDICQNPGGDHSDEHAEYHSSDEIIERSSDMSVKLASELIRLHHGTFTSWSVESHRITAIVTIPIAREHYSSAETIVSENAEDQSLQLLMEQLKGLMPDEQQMTPETFLSPKAAQDAPCVLLVEDNAELMLLMRQMLNSHCRVAMARNSKEANELLEILDVNLVVTEEGLPDKDGIQLVASIKQNDATAGIPVLVVSSRPDEEYRNFLMDHGADDCLAKPFRMRDLWMHIENLLGPKQVTKVIDNATGEIAVETTSSQPTPEEEFLRKVTQLVDDHLDDSDYDREALAADMGSSSSTLYNKLRAITGQNVSTFIRNRRISTACRLGKEDPELRVSDIAYKVGFRDPKYFATTFKKVMGVQPSEYFSKAKDR